MKFGLCGSVQDAAVAADAGFDYIELWAAKIFADDYELPALALPVEATNGFFPDSVTLFGPDATPWRPYVLATLPRAQSAGVKQMVVGSGRARKAHTPSDEAAFLEICDEIHALAAEFGIVTGPEPLNGKECNLGNDQGAMALGLASRSYVSDAYHVLVQAELDGTVLDWEAALPYAPTHVHVANLARTVPTASDAALLGFAARLREVGFSGRVSFEGNVGRSLEELTALRKVLASLFSGSTQH